MAEELPPTDYFSGITFNRDFYQSNSTEYLTATDGKKLFLSYPLSQGSETFSSNVKLQSTLTDTSGSVGTSGQILSSTTTGVSWINGVGNSYISYNTSSLPFTLSLASNSNLYILFSGTTNSGGIMTIPTTGITNGTYIHVKNTSSGTVNLSSSFIQFQSGVSSIGIIDLNAGESFQAYFNGANWVQSSITKKVANLTIEGTLTVGAFGTDTLIQKANHTTGEEINLYSTTTTGDIFIGKILPAGNTLRLCNTTSGTSGASVHCANIGIDGSNINNATNPGSGIVKIGNSLTSGALYIGGGSTTAAHTSGPIIIGADSTGTGGINIGTDTDLTVPTVDTINIGSATYATHIKGTLKVNGLLTADGGLTLNTGDLITANGGLTIGGAYGITLTTSLYTPTSAQLGYFGRAYNSAAIVNYSAGAIGNDIVNTGTNIGIGIYQMMWTVSVNNWTNGTSAYINFSFNTSGGITMYGVPQAGGATPPTTGSEYIMQLQGVANSATLYATFNFSCIVQSTGVSQEINLRGKINAGTNAARTPIGHGQVTYIKIA